MVLWSLDGNRRDVRRAAISSGLLVDQEGELVKGEKSRRDF